MKIICIIILFTSVQAFARTALYREPETPPKLEKREFGPETKSVVSKTQRSSNPYEASPKQPRKWLMAEMKASPIVTNQGATLEVVDSLKPGDIKTAIIHQGLIALADAKSPVAALVELKSGEKFTLIGEATLERNSKRILLEFTKLRRSLSSQTFDVKAQALDSLGVYGVEGEYHSGASTFFLAELLSAGAAGWADSTISRSQNVLGQTVEENSADTNSKKAVSTALNRTSDRFAEKVRQAPEFSVLRGPTVVQIFFVDQPTRTK